MKSSVAVVLLAIASPLFAQTPTPLHSVLAGNGLVKPLWVGQAPGDDTRLFVMEQKQCDIEIFKNGVKNAVPFLDLTGGTTGLIKTGGNEQGLLGLAFDPDYQNNHFLYVEYTRNPDGAGVVERYTALDDDDADPASGLVIFGPIADPQSNHNGGCILFGPDGKLYIGLGDGGNENDVGTGHGPNGNGQAHDSFWGKMHRINSDGTVPADNPFLGDPTFLPSIWDYGIRNPWRFSFDRQTGDIWIGDVGQDAHEEVDLEPAGSGGHNYGWRCMEGFSCSGLGGCTCFDPSLTPPIYDYPHSGGKCSITGGYNYRGDALPDWNGTYFFADYCTGQIFSFRYTGVLPVATDESAAIAPGGGLAINLVTSFGEDNAGELYICDQGGEVFKMVPGGPFTGLGHALAGVTGNPVLWGEGTLVTGTAGALDIKNVAPSAGGLLFVSLGAGSAAFKGGVLVAVPVVAMLPIAVDGGGATQIAWASWPSVPSATTIVFQAGFNDAAAVKGVSLTNALSALTP